MRLDDARTILTDVLNYQIADSLVKEYEAKDNEKSKIIILQKQAIIKLTEKSENQELQIANLEEIIKNKDTEIGYKDDIIKQQKKEIRKQKVLKIVGFSSAIILPVVTALVLLK
jgi:uncharacterized membrane protein YgaE (UPF0421/DUF939 family)